MEYLIPSLAAVISLTALGAVFGLVLSFAKQKLQVEHDPRIEKILEALPGANCGACGQPGCAGYASKIVKGEVEINLCSVGGADTLDDISQVMGVISVGMKPTVARVMCQGARDVTRRKFIYEGPRSCHAAQQVMGGFKTCQYGCLGLGDCTRVCPFDAIHMDEKQGLPVVDFDKCTGCGKCVNECPRNIIRLVDRNFEVYVICRSNRQDAGYEAGMRCGLYRLQALRQGMQGSIQGQPGYRYRD